MRVLLTGGSGFLGRRVALLFEKSGDEVTHLWRTKKNVQNEVVWDFKGQLPAVPKVDALVHLAAHADFSPDSQRIYVENILPCIRLADWAKKNKTPIYFASLADMHADSDIWGHSSPLRFPRPYSHSKYLAELFFRQIDPQTNMYRLNGIYGVNGPQHLGLNTSITQALKAGIPPVLRGDGVAKRNYISVTDAARWIVADVKAQAAQGKTIYMAGPESMSIKKWLETVVEVLLPGKTVVAEKGKTSAHVIVESSPAPFVLQPFREYLLQLKR